MQFDLILNWERGFGGAMNQFKSNANKLQHSIERQLMIGLLLAGKSEFNSQSGSSFIKFNLISNQFVELNWMSWFDCRIWERIQFQPAGNLISFFCLLAGSRLAGVGGFVFILLIRWRELIWYRKSILFKPTIFSIFHANLTSAFSLHSISSSLSASFSFAVKEKKTERRRNEWEKATETKWGKKNESWRN